MQTFIGLQFDKMSDRFIEIRALTELAAKHLNEPSLYKYLCRSAHVLLVSHFEGIYKDICRDVIDDINANIKFIEVKKEIFNTYCGYFIQKDEDAKFAQTIRQRLKEALEAHQAKLKVEPFLFVDNKNPAPSIIEAILTKFGIIDFFWSIDGSDLDLVFEDQKSDTERLRKRLWNYAKRNVSNYPYTVSEYFYNPVKKIGKKSKKTLWETFLNEFLKGRHDIVHGDTVNNPISHEDITDAITKIEILVLAFIINVCSAATPLRALPERL
jgi:hypothetical protein